MKTRILGILVGAACLGLLAACGGSDETTEALTKAEFIAQGDEICADGDKELEAKAEEMAESGIDLENPSEAEREELVVDAFVPSLKSQAAALRELGPPEGEEDAVEAMVDALEEATRELEDEPSLAFSETDNPLEEASELATEFGFENCGS